MNICLYHFQNHRLVLLMENKSLLKRINKIAPTIYPYGIPLRIAG